MSDLDEFLRQTLMGACSPPVPLLEGVSIIASRIGVENPSNLPVQGILKLHAHLPLQDKSALLVQT